jgi:hypothetical protein
VASMRENSSAVSLGSEDQGATPVKFQLVDFPGHERLRP